MDVISYAAANAAKQANVALQSRLASIADKNNRRIFHDDGNLTENWTKTQPAGEWTVLPENITGAGGAIINFSGSSAGAKITALPKADAFNTAAALRTPAHRPWVASTEIFLSAAGGCVFGLYNGSTLRAGVRLGNGSTSKVEIFGGAAWEDVSSKLPEWVQTGVYIRLMIWINPITLKARYYAYYSTAASINLGQHVFLGETTISGTLGSLTLTVESITGSNQTIQVKATRVYEVFMVANGCSTDACFKTFDTSPNVGRAEAFRETRANGPLALSYRLNGGNDWPINHARGGFLVKEMREEFQTMVAALLPRIVTLGSATNSIGAVVSGTTTMATVQQEYLEMVEAALAINTDGYGTPPVVMATTISPRHDEPNFTTEAHRKELLVFNEWMKATLPAKGVIIRDVWSALAGPELKLVEWADPGEHLHWTLRAVQVTAEIGFHALMKALATA